MPRRIIEDAPPLGSTVASPRELNRGGALLTPKEAAEFLRVSESWLAKARMRGDGPPYAQFGRAIRYPQNDLVAYVRSRRRLSTSDKEV